MEKKSVLHVLLLLLLVSSWGINAQNGFYLTHNQKHVDIPFEYINNFIIITVQVNQTLPLKFIFDSGAEHTILSKSELADILRLDYEREFKVMGADMKTELIAYLARKVHFEINEKAISLKEDILVLKEDYFRFEEFSGIEAHGILSANIFSKFIIKINYQSKVISLYDRAFFKGVGEGFTALPIEVFRNKIYLNTQLEVLKDSIAQVKLLIDTGAGLPLLVFTNTHALLKPPKNAIIGNIGMGLGGFIDGFNGRVAHLKIGDFEQNQIVSQFQALDSINTGEHFNHRNGLIGNTILSRFIIFIDFEKEILWLKPTKNYKRAFEYDKSGLSIIVSGKNLSTILVQHVLPNSPAAEQGFEKGDQIISVGRIPTKLMSLEDILQKLKSKSGKKVRIVLRKDGKRVIKNLILRDLI
jgi:PDZ domain